MAFCAALPGVCAFVGQIFTCNFIYPCIENALVDVEVMVVGKALEAVTSLIQLNLLTKLLLVPTLKTFACLIVHPTEVIRNLAAVMVAEAAKALGMADTDAILKPILAPLFRFDAAGAEITASFLSSAVLPPVPLRAFRTAMLKRRNQLSSGSEVSGVSVDPSRPIVRMDIPLTPPLADRSSVLAAPQALSVAAPDIDGSAVLIRPSELSPALALAVSIPDDSSHSTYPPTPPFRSPDGAEKNVETISYGNEHFERNLFILILLWLIGMAAESATNASAVSIESAAEVLEVLQ